MKKLLLIFGGIAGFGSLYAQTLSPEVIASSGTNLSGPGGGMEYTIGEVATATLTAGSDVLTQGFHQPNIEIVGVEEFLDAYSIDLYPNPINDFVNIETDSDAELKVQVYTAHGQLVMSSETFINKVVLDVQNMANGPYVFKVSRADGTPVKNFSVIKNRTH
jgi:hypothetical protein